MFFPLYSFGICTNIDIFVGEDNKLWNSKDSAVFSPFIYLKLGYQKMIVDSMTKYEVMSSLRKEFDEYIFPYYTRKIFPKLQASLSQKCMREKRKCYANFFKEGYIVVYPAHCLQRYSERVLKDNLDIEVVFKNHLIKRQESAFNIVLPTPTHKYSQYVGFADALFLGDFDEKHPKTSFLWLNTCISYDETGYSQSKIMKSLHEMQKYVNGVKIDFSDIKNKKVLQQYIKKKFYKYSEY